jgi:hypothetical protein
MSEPRNTTKLDYLHVDPTPPASGDAALLREFDGSVCPACHHHSHDPGSCPACPRCELHTDEALAFVLRYEPELVAALTPPPPSEPTLDTRTHFLQNWPDKATMTCQWHDDCEWVAARPDTEPDPS